MAMRPHVDEPTMLQAASDTSPSDAPRAHPVFSVRTLIHCLCQLRVEPYG